MSWLASAWDTTTELLALDFVQVTLVACVLLGILSGVMAPLIVLRQMSFSVHATSELALMGASAALLFGLNVGLGAVAGAIVAAVVLAALGFRGQQDSAVGVVMSFGMGLSVLFIHLYPGNSNRALSLLTGQIVGVSGQNLIMLAVTALLVVAAVVVLWRPMLFASADPVMAAACGVRVRTMSLIFAVLVGIASAQSVQIVGALLVMSLLITPGAAAAQITANPVHAVWWSVLFAEVSAVGGMILSLAPGVPVSVFVAFISFGIYLVCRLISRVRGRRIRVAAGRSGAGGGAGQSGAGAL
ncbi:helicase [Corynebacterium sp. BCW_4722]|nr:helicase [Corynebacterium sp. BCW_4722]